jgi:ABC-type Mn2+/Zn2+ transport system ATPase subunit
VTQAARECAIRFAGVSVDRAGRRVLEDVSFALDAGDFLGVVGPNGAGKTTLLRAILGLVPIAAGRIEVFGRALRGPGDHPSGVGYVPQRQEIPRRFPASVEDAVALGLPRDRAGLRSRAAAREAVRRNLALVGIEALALRPVGELSGGEQRRVMLAQALCAGTRLLVLDEPTSGLDLPAEHEFYALLRRLQRELSHSVVAVSHDLVALAGEADVLICINRRMHVHGNPEDVIHSHAIREAYSCEFDFLAGELAHHERGIHPAPGTGPGTGSG